MKDHILVKDSKYEGKYVAFQSVDDHTIIADGDEPERVMKEAKEKGAKQPLLMFIPNKDMSFCFNADS
jgi:hypothetical protein